MYLWNLGKQKVISYSRQVAPDFHLEQVNLFPTKQKYLRCVKTPIAKLTILSDFFNASYLTYMLTVTFINNYVCVN